MSRISILCPKCHHSISIDIATIDHLRNELEAVKRERDTYRARLAALEVMRKNDPVGDILRRIGL